MELRLYVKGTTKAPASLTSETALPVTLDRKLDGLKFHSACTV
jgi:hypothetical protein